MLWGGANLNHLQFLNRDWWNTRLFGPIVALTSSALLLLVITSGVLIYRFDRSAALRELHVVENGFAQQTREFNAVVATQVGWDDAVQKLDHKFDPDWADFNIGNYLHTFNGFSHAFIVDRDEKVFYAAVDGERTALAKFAPFAEISSQLLPVIRKAEASRPLLRERPGKNNIKIHPIQANSVAQISGQTYIITTTLVQPDFGKVVPKSSRAPVTITAMPIDRTMLAAFAERYLLTGAKLVDASVESSEGGKLVLRDHAGDPVAALAWQPQQPGTMVLRQIAIPLLIALAMLCIAAWSILRRGTSIFSDLLKSEKRTKYLAYHDVLTSLPNRAQLFERLQAALIRLGEGTDQLAVMCVDLDRFKEVNDTLGHHAGDVLIAKVASRLRQLCGDEAMIARLGGDEFVVLCEDHGPERVAILAARMLEAVRKPIRSEYGKLEVGCSIGVVMIERAGVSPSEALRWADLALYRSKDLGRMRVTFFEPEMDEELRNRRALEADLRQALNDGDLTLAYQPQVDRNGKITTIEALLRWTHPVRGEVTPGVFIPLAEETGLVLALGEFVLRQVFFETRDWLSVRVAINVSAVQMRSPGFAALVTRLIAQCGVDPSRYEFELTETALLGDDPITRGNLEALKRLGFSLALDDFGTGYSSLSVLQRFSVDRIKIDQSFVSGLAKGGESDALIDAMVRLACALSLGVIAEGVETQEQMERLVACGCREFQGHLIGMPIGAQATAELLGEVLPETRRAISLRG